MDAGNVFVFTGENRFALQQECSRWQREFVERHGEDNLLRRSGAKATVRELLDDVSVAPFLASKRLVLIDGIPKMTPEDVEVLCSQIHPSVIALFIELPGSRVKTGLKELLARATVKEFPELKGQKLLDWTVLQAKAEGTSIAPDAAKRLITLLQGDQQYLEQEIRKLALFATGRPISLADVESMVLPLEGVIWTVTDAVVASAHTRAVQEAQRLLKSGIEPNALWAGLLHFMRQLTVMVAAFESDPNPQTVAQRAGIHPFAARTMLPYVKRLKLRDIAKAVSKAADRDRALKTGGLRSADDDGQELCAAIDELLLTLP